MLGRIVVVIPKNMMELIWELLVWILIIIINRIVSFDFIFYSITIFLDEDEELTLFPLKLLNMFLVWLYDSDEPQWDPNGVLSWLSNELHQSELLGERVWIS